MIYYALTRLHEKGKKAEFFRTAGISVVWEDDFNPGCLCSENELSWLLEMQKEQGCGSIIAFQVNTIGVEEANFVIRQSDGEPIVVWNEVADETFNDDDF